ncbi:ComEC family competence protein [Patescibacteria group bacterium]|nr:ComEC family competence protein [Candidatus Falkowbacteria bacterium]MBU3906237.1 ComEC family competence protein [Patescibacteria group bacterium]MBU4014579.1 ComEC family competence protein [Patescibacteria group bacterium]MBU4026866.1 ComEC family competence protein [Patescibacteria group bacterium]MBU4073430.1 ComEC family competence protein [Patescibacteria group bacterium]
MAKSKIFLICCFAFIAGVAIASFAPVKIIQNDLWWFAAMAVCGVAVILFRRVKNEGAPMSIGAPSFFVLLFGLFLFLGIWRYSLSLPVDDPSKIWHYNGQTVAAMGVVNNEPDDREKSKKLEVRSKKLKILQDSQSSKGDWNFVSGKILVTTNLYPRYNYGDELELICNLQAPERFNGFDYDRYLARYDIYSVCYYPAITPSPSPAAAVAREGSKIVSLGFKTQANNFYKKIFNVKNKFRAIINFGLGEPEASLAKAIFLGDKKSMPDDLRDKFSQAGISHIAAISGMHISILAGLVMAIFLGIGMARKQAFWLSSLFLLFYILLIGLPASAMRAGLMGFLFLWAMRLGRLNKITNALVLAAAALLVLNPKLLRDDIGFQLSFLAVIGIIYFYPILNNFFDKFKIPKLKGVRDIFNITIAAQITTLPIIALNFSQVSLIAPISNLLILWTLPLLITVGIAAIFLSLLFPCVGFLFFLPAGLFLKYIIIIAEQSVKLPYAYVEVNYLWRGWAIVYYGIVGWAIFKYKKYATKTL